MDFVGMIIEILGIGCTVIKGGKGWGSIGMKCLFCPKKDKRIFF